MSNLNRRQFLLAGGPTLAMPFLLGGGVEAAAKTESTRRYRCKWFTDGSGHYFVTGLLPDDDAFFRVQCEEDRFKIGGPSALGAMIVGKLTWRRKRRGQPEWVFWMGPRCHNLGLKDKVDLDTAKRLAERWAAEEIRACLTEIERMVFAITKGAQA